MRIILITLLFSYINARADGITLPVLPTAPQVVTSPKNDDVLPIAPTRYDDHADAPATVFSSVNKDDPWEKFERGENPKEGGLKTENIAKKVNVKDKSKRDVASVGKNKQGKATKTAKNVHTKTVKSSKVTKKITSKKGKVAKHGSSKKTKRTPSSKLPSKKRPKTTDQQ